MSWRRVAERRDRQVVDANQSEMALDEGRRSAGIETHEVLLEATSVPERGVRRAKQQPRLAGRNCEPRDVGGRDRSALVARVDDPGRTHERVERNRLGAGAAVQE